MIGNEPEHAAAAAATEAALPIFDAIETMDAIGEGEGEDELICPPPPPPYGTKKAIKNTFT